jgi:two-component sensor histidine kinase
MRQGFRTRNWPKAQIGKVVLSIFQMVALIFVVAVSTFCSTAEAAETKRVMVLHSFGRDFKPWNLYGSAIRTELEQRSPWPIEIIDQSLMTARGWDENPEVPFVQYLYALFEKRPLDLVVSIGAPAASFVQRHRQQLFPMTPMIFTAVEQRRVQQSSLTEFDTVVAVAHDLPAIVENILQVLPGTKTIAVVNGDSTNERFWLEELRREFTPFADRVSFIWYNDRSFEDILRHAAALPSHSAIFWHLMSVDAAGVAHEGERALQRLYAAANAPIFTYDGGFFGREIVGGPMHSVANLARLATDAAIRILAGETAGDIKTPGSPFATPVYDWRLLQRWRISESDLPAGSEVRFRAPTMWEQYKATIVAAIAVVVAQAGMIAWLIRYVREIARVRDEVRVLNASLEERVEQRTADLGQARDRAEVLLAEVNHRVGNSLSLVASLVTLQTNVVTEQAAKDALAATQARIYAISSVNKQLYASGDVRSVPMDEYLSGLLDQLATSTQNQAGGATLRYDFEPLKLPTDTTINLGVVVTELVINAFKYAYPSQPGEVRVRLKQIPNRRGELVVEDDGVGRGDEGSAKGTGLGTKIVNAMARTMGAEIEYLKRQPGTAARLVFPMPA